MDYSRTLQPALRQGEVEEGGGGHYGGALGSDGEGEHKRRGEGASPSRAPAEQVRACQNDGKGETELHAQGIMVGTDEDAEREVPNGGRDERLRAAVSSG